MEELANIRKVTRPHVVLLVVDAMTGQDAVNVAEQFAEVAQFDGVVLSKLDGDARGGAALSVKAVTGKPILFASTGEKLGDFERFHPDRMAQRILGMGDVLSFIEKAESSFEEDEAKELERKLRKNQFGLDDFLDQLKRIRKMGPLTSLLGMIPGLAGHQLSKMQVDEKEFDRDRGDHPLHDALRAAPPGADQGLAAAAHRQGLGHDGPAGQPARQAVRRDAQADEGHAAGQDARSRPDDAKPLGAAPRRYPARPNMSVSMRLTRVGGKKDPVWRVVVADRRSPRDGRVIETIGRYNAQTDPSTIVLDEERVRHWLDRGAQPSEAVHKLLKTQGISR